MDWPTGIRPRGAGLEVSIWKGKRRVYCKTLHCDPYAKADLAAAIKHRDEKVARLRAGLPLRDDLADRSAVVFADAAQEYLDGLQIGKRQKAKYRNDLNTYWMPAFGNYLITDITRGKIKVVLAEMRVKIKTQKNRLEPLRGVLTHAEIIPNPAAGIQWSRTQRKAQRARVERYEPAERDAIIRALDALAHNAAALAQEKPTQANRAAAHWSGLARVYFPLLFATGLRPGEALGLDIPDFNGEYLNVETQRAEGEEKAHTKTGERREVYVPEWVRPRLKDHVRFRESGAFFLGQRGSALRDTKRLNKVWQKAHDKALLRYRVPYVCRHTRAAELLSRGMDSAVAARELGHSIPMFLENYSELIDGYRLDAERRDMTKYESVPPKRVVA